MGLLSHHAANLITIRQFSKKIFQYEKKVFIRNYIKKAYYQRRSRVMDSIIIVSISRQIPA